MIRGVGRYLRLYTAFVRNCVIRAMEFRAQFWIHGVIYLIWSSTSVLFIHVLFQNVGVVRDWTAGEMYVLFGTYIILESLSYGLVGPNMWRFNSYVRDGMLDFVLTKPVNSQFFSSTRYLDLNGVANGVVGIAVIAYGLQRAERVPDVFSCLGWLMTMACGLIMAYALWFMIVTLTVWTVRMDAAGAAFEPVLQLARMPINIYPQRMQMMLTFVLPVAFMTTIPASFLLGRGKPVWMGMALLGAMLFLGLSNRFWNVALKYYGSASS